MQGRRVDAKPDGTPLLQPGDYGKDVDGFWHCCPPQPVGEWVEYFFGNLRAHTVVEHEDRTITVSPSILITRRSPEVSTWHGFLERGVWRQV